jgi:outer membrane protein OmpA-like peptidoglycan-associated protein
MSYVTKVAVIVMGLLVSHSLMGVRSLGAASGCDKAREIYRQATSLLNYEERRTAFQQAVDLCPHFAEARVNLADSLENLATMHKNDAVKFNSFLDLAATQYGEAIKSRSDLFPAYLGLGETLRVMGLYEQSQQAYSQALQLKPGHPAAAAGLEKIRTIKSLEKEGFKNSDEIVTHFRKASENSGHGTLMGFRDETAIKDRVRFNNILFDEWSFRPTHPEAVRQLKEIGEALSSPELKDTSFVVEGHTDSRGGEERNMNLSAERAEAVKDYLIENFKVDASRIQAQGFGFSRPRFPNDSPVNMAKNRRVELLFLDRRSGK